MTDLIRVIIILWAFVAVIGSLVSWANLKEKWIPAFVFAPVSLAIWIIWLAVRGIKLVLFEVKW